MEIMSAAKKYLSCMCGSVKGTRSVETNASLTIRSPSSGTTLRQLTRQSKHTREIVSIVPGFSSNPGSFGSHWYRLGAFRVKSENSPACVGYVTSNSTRGLPVNQAGKIEATYVRGMMRKE
jgi:hypothetical protein